MINETDAVTINPAPTMVPHDVKLPTMLVRLPVKKSTRAIIEINHMMPRGMYRLIVIETILTASLKGK
jgi:hypothetical protein